jgi:hypothetical protein
MKVFPQNMMLLTLAVLALSGCVTSPMPPPGLIYEDQKGPNHALEHKHEAKKHGESCAGSVLGLVAWGDASIESARKSGDIRSIAEVDYSNFDILGIVYTKTCAIVTGS